MAITRAQQARQMLKTAGAVEQDGVLNYIKNSESVTVPKEFKARKNAPATKLAYITAEEAKMLKKMKKGTPHKGPKGIPSYDSFDAQGNFRSGAEMSAAESGDRDAFGRDPESRKEAQDIRSSVIAAGGGQRVNPSFFDSRNTVSRDELARAKAFNPTAFARNRRGGFLDFLTGGGITGALIRKVGQRFGFGKTFDQPTYDMRNPMDKFNRLGLYTDRISTNPNNLDIYNEFVDEDDTTIPRISERDMSIPIIPRISERDMSIPVTPFQKDVIEDTQDQADDPFLKGAVADLNKPGLIQLRNYQKQKGMAPLDPNIDFTDEDQKMLDELLRREADPDTTYGPVFAADGGMIGGGIMDVAGRQQYFLGKLVKKAKRAVKKIVKSPIGKLGLMGLATLPFGGPAAAFTKFKALSPGIQALVGGGALSALPLIFGQEEEEQPTGFTGSVGGQIDPRAYTDPQSVLFRAFRAEGGSMKEPVAKRTMPLLDMDGQEMDLRAEGGFVPIGRMEKADDVPARLSKNEFVFTADAVRNAGEGDVDKGAEVMYNMMKNLEAGGDVSEESQGLEGARNMFQTSKRLEDVV